MLNVDAKQWDFSDLVHIQFMFLHNRPSVGPIEITFLRNITKLDQNFKSSMQQVSKYNVFPQSDTPNLQFCHSPES
jgi:hypothetical protein